MHGFSEARWWQMADGRYADRLLSWADSQSVSRAANGHKQSVTDNRKASMR
jgi:hypothetical protein